MNGLLTGADSTVPGFPSLPLDPGKIVEITQAMRADGVGYGLGCKARDITASPPQFITPGGAPCHEIDCSGFNRYATWHATGGRVTFPDGSVNIHDAVDAAGLKKTDVSNCALQDGRVRLLILSPGYEGVGHILFVYNGRTYESHGGRGPDSRAWGSCAWMQATKFLTCYVLS